LENFSLRKGYRAKSGNSQSVRWKKGNRRNLNRSLIVICAYNEANTLLNILPSLEGFDVLVVDDGSNDGTSEVATQCGAMVISHHRRMGKAVSLRDGITFAVDRGFEIVVELGADALPEKGSIWKLIEALSGRDVAAASARQIPLGPANIAYRIDELLWAVLTLGKRLQMERLGTSHLGAVMFAFRPKGVQVIDGCVNDDEEVGIQILIRGGRVRFVPEAIAYFDSSSSLGHIVERRRRMLFGHMMYRESTAPSMQMPIVTVALLKSILEKPERFVWLVPALITEGLCRLIAWRDVRRPNMLRKYTHWVTTYEKNTAMVIRALSLR